MHHLTRNLKLYSWLFTVSCALLLLVMLSASALAADDTMSKVWTDDFSSELNWETIQGTWSIKSRDGKNALYNAATGIILAPVGEIEDYTIEVKTLNAGGTGAGAHIVFRFLDLNHYFMFRVNPATQRAELYVRDGVFAVLAEVPCEVQYNQWYEMKIVSVGDQIEAYVNGVKVLSYEDSRFRQGKVGFRSHAAETYYTDVRINTAVELTAQAVPASTVPADIPLRAANPNLVFPTATQRSMWVWKTIDIVLNPKVQDEFFAFVAAPFGQQEHGITMLLFTASWALNDTSVLRDSLYLPKLRAFLKRAHANGLRVHCLEGNHDWRFREQHPQALAALNRMLDFNAAGAPDERFDGIHFDIEKVKDVQDQYLELVQQLAAEIDKRGGGVALGFDIPSWFDEPRWAYLDQKVLQVADYIGLMNYWDNPQQLIDGAIGELEYAASVNKKVLVGIDVAPKQDASQLITTYYDEGWAKMEEDLALVFSRLSQYPSFAGFAIHSYDYYWNLPAVR